jgi:hypothetical protein
MKRRSLFLLPLLAFPARLFGQDPPRRASTKTAKARTASATDDEGAPAKARKSKSKSDDGEAPDGGPDSTAPDATPANFPNQSGFQWRNFPIGDYTALDPNGKSPQTAIIDWIFRRTGTGAWHGDKIAVLCASRTQLRAYNSAKWLDYAAETIERFTDADSNVLSVQVRFIAAADSRWRYAVHQRLTPVQSGPQGQQCWFCSVADAEMVISQMQVWQGFKLLDRRTVGVLNGQTVKFEQVVERPFTAGVQRESAVGLGFQPKVEKLMEGVVLKFSPLLTYEGDSLEAAVEMSTNLVRKLHPVKVLAPREVGPAELTLDVPEASETRLNQTIKNWPLGQVLIISAGIQPGILMDKGGFLNLKIPGTVPTGTELLVVINVETVKDKEKKSRDRDP